MKEELSDIWEKGESGVRGRSSALYVDDVFLLKEVWPRDIRFNMNAGLVPGELSLNSNVLGWRRE